MALSFWCLRRWGSKRLRVVLPLSIAVILVYALCRDYDMSDPPYSDIEASSDGRWDPQISQAKIPNSNIYKSRKDFENFNNVSGTPNGVLIVPNVVHFIRFGENEMTFIEAVCVLAALKNQRPESLVIHTDHVNQGGKYWDVVLKHPLAQGVLKIKYRPEPEYIFGQRLDYIWKHHHAGDVARLELLMEEGGIFLDGDSYIVRNLDEFRKFEMTLGWQTDGGISNQAIIAHKHARFLRLWYMNYVDYRRNVWFYNAGDKPTDILKHNQHLIHRVPALFAEYKPIGTTLTMLYLNRTHEWIKHYVIHLLINHQYLIPQRQNGTYPVKFDDNNIFQYNAAIQDMALAVYPFPMQRM